MNKQLIKWKLDEENDSKNSIVVDIDGTIFEYKTYTKNSWGALIDGAIKMLKNLTNDYNVILFTARGEDERSALESYLKERDVPYNELRMGKPIAVAYLDDRAIEFKGSWEGMDKKIKDLQELQND